MKSTTKVDAFFEIIITILISVLAANTLDYFGVFSFWTALAIVALSWLPVGLLSAEIIDRVPPLVSEEQGYLPDLIKREWRFYGWYGFWLAVPILIWACFRLGKKSIRNSFSK